MKQQTYTQIVTWSQIARMLWAKMNNHVMLGNLSSIRETEKCYHTFKFWQTLYL